MAISAKRDGVAQVQFRPTIFDRFQVMHNDRAHGAPFAAAMNAKKAVPSLRRNCRVAPCLRLVELLERGAPHQNGVLVMVRRAMTVAEAVRSNSPAPKRARLRHVISRGLVVILFNQPDVSADRHS